MSAARDRHAGRTKRSNSSECECTPKSAECSTPAFYTRSHITPSGLTIQSSDKVSQATLERVGRLMSGMISPQLEKPVKGYGGLRIAVLAKEEQIVDLPEYCWMKTECTFDGRCYSDVRAMGAVNASVPTVVSEDDVTCAADAYYWEESIAVHEFAHTIMDVVVKDNMPDVYDRILAAYDKALSSGAIPKGLYISANANEYWANIVTAYFSATARTDVNAGINTRTKLKEADPDGYALVEEVFKDAPGMSCATDARGHYCCQ